MFICHIDQQKYLIDNEIQGISGMFGKNPYSSMTLGVCYNLCSFRITDCLSILQYFDSNVLS
jgi:hypothetical protein